MLEAYYNTPLCIAGEVWLHLHHSLDKMNQLTSPICQGHPAGEDTGGMVGWEDLKEIFIGGEDRYNRKVWYKTYCANGDRDGSFDPFKWDISKVNTQLRRLKRR